MAGVGPAVKSESQVLEAHPASPFPRLALTVVTPKGSVLAHDVDEIVAPGELGEFDLLPGHVPFLSALKPGVLRIRDGQDKVVLAVGSGFVQVGGTAKVQVLVQMAVPAAEVVVAEVLAEKERLEAQLAKLYAAPPEQPGVTPAGPSRRELVEHLAWASAQLAAAALGGGASAPSAAH